MRSVLTQTSVLGTILSACALSIYIGYLTYIGIKVILCSYLQQELTREQRHFHDTELFHFITMLITQYV